MSGSTVPDRGEIVECKAGLFEALKWAIASLNLSFTSLGSAQTAPSLAGTFQSRAFGSNRRHGVYNPTIVCEPRPRAYAKDPTLADNRPFCPKISTIMSLPEGITRFTQLPRLVRYFMFPLEQPGRPSPDINTDLGILPIQPHFDGPPTEPVQWAVAIAFQLEPRRGMTRATRKWTNTNGVTHRIPGDMIDMWVSICRTKQAEFIALPRDIQRELVDELKTFYAQRFAYAQTIPHKPSTLAREIMLKQQQKAGNTPTGPYNPFPNPGSSSETSPRLNLKPRVRV